jgi:hypothetical protein
METACVAAKSVLRCPLWVKSGRGPLKLRCPLYPRKRTRQSADDMSALGQKQTRLRTGSFEVHLRIVRLSQCHQVLDRFTRQPSGQFASG